MKAKGLLKSPALTAAGMAFTLIFAPATFAQTEQDIAVETREVEPRQVVTHFFVAEGEATGQQTVVGNSKLYEVKAGQTFLDISREVDVGYNEILAANPLVDPWVPPAGSDVIVPSEWILPRGNHAGVVLNIPEMRIYYYLPSPRAGGKSSMVVTYPVGLGRQDWQTPQAQFRIRGKTRNPAWVIPESIKKERIADYGSTESVIPGGHPENPLGKHRLELTLPSYAIHGTNRNWGVGMQVSHGCVRMYPEDIAALFPLVPVGTPGEFLYQPVKVGVRRGRVMVEVHEDIYGVAPWPWMLAQDLVKEMGLERFVDKRRLEAVVEAASGIPTDVGFVGWPDKEEERTVRFDELGNPRKPYAQVVANR